jgi:type IV conjugative transfer system protein TraL
MRARVYRYLDSKAAWLGLHFPDEWLVVAAPFVFGLLLNAMLIGTLIAVPVYVVMRVVGYGKPEQFFVHWFQFRLRRARGGRYLSAARARRTPRFPFAAYVPNAGVQARLSAVLRALGATPDGGSDR